MLCDHFRRIGVTPLILKHVSEELALFFFTLLHHQIVLMNNNQHSSPNNKRHRNEQDQDQVLDKSRYLNAKSEPAKLLSFFQQQRNIHQDEDKYMLSKSWYLFWEKYCLGLADVLPPSINNRPLLQEDDSLKPNLKEEEDYILVPYTAWVHLLKWYGLARPSYEITYTENTKKVKTKATAVKEFKKKKSNIPSPLTAPEEKIVFKIYDTSKTTNQMQMISVSPKSAISEFQTCLLRALDITSGTNFELWLLNSKHTNAFSSHPVPKEILKDPRFAEYIDTSNINTDSTISNFLDHMTSSTSSTFATKSDNNYYHLAVEYISNRKKSNAFTNNVTIPPGICGLQNLGNTCYMNSALQCLSNTPQLTKWILRGDYKRDINTTNPLGSNGEVVEAFANIIKSIWKSQSALRPSIAPKEFKSTFERFNPHFVGYQQHDSQEFLSFLLDGLHEDLNRVLEKPYMEIPDFDDMLSDKEVATCFWNYHKARNNSYLVDLFQGQFKSRLICDECKKVSVTYDAFMYLSLPLPAETNCEIEVVYVPYLPSQRQLKMTIQLNKDANISHLKQEIENNIISSSLSISNNHSLLVVEMYHGKIFRILADTDSVSYIRPSDSIYVYQVPCPSITANDDWVIFPVYCATTIDVQEPVIPSTQFGFPIVLALEKKNLTSMEDLYKIIAHHIERYCIVKLFEEDALFEGKSSQEATEEDKKDEDLLTPHYQQPIHTTAAVTAAGGRPMVPMPNLFNIKIFDREDKSLGSLSRNFLNFPTGSSVCWTSGDTDVKDSIILQQGQGVLLEWNILKAQQVFGSHSSTSRSLYDHDHHSDINTEAWREFEELASNNSTFKKSRMTTRSASSKISCTLEDCLNEFTNDEKLSSDDLWYCPRCKKHQRASKKIDIWRLPDIMVVHLKRFSQVRSWGNKIDTFIDFPIQGLDMTDRVLSTSVQGGESNLIYDLYAIDNHYGGLGGGHYTAYAQNFYNKEWYNFDDSHVSKVTTKDIKTNAAYLLFYKRRK